MKTMKTHLSGVLTAIPVARFLPDASPEGQRTKPSGSKGFTLVEVLMVVGIVVVLTAIAVPGLLSARMFGNEASAIASIRTISSAEATFASTCGAGGYAVTLADLALAPTAGGQAFIPADLAAASTGGSPKSGYEFTITGGTGDNVLAAADTCNGSANASESEFFAIADPIAVGSTGRRFFAANQSGQIREDPAQLADMTAGSPLQ